MKPIKTPFGGDRSRPSPTKDTTLGVPKLPSKKAVELLTSSKSGGSSVAKFGELTPIGRRTRKSDLFG